MKNLYNIRFEVKIVTVKFKFPEEKNFYESAICYQLRVGSNADFFSTLLMYSTF
jgi:hypothetical protein